MFVGRGRILAFNEDSFIPGKPHVVEVACDLWPTIKYEGEKGYKGLKVTVPTGPADSAKIDAVTLILSYNRIISVSSAHSCWFQRLNYSKLQP